LKRRRWFLSERNGGGGLKTGVDRFFDFVLKLDVFSAVSFICRNNTEGMIRLRITQSIQS